MNEPFLTFRSPLSLVIFGLVLATACLPLVQSAESTASGKTPPIDKPPTSEKAPEKAPVKDNALPAPVWYWVKLIDIPANNPLRKGDIPDLMITVERNGVELGETDVKKRSWTCVYEKKYQNLFPFRQKKNEAYTFTIFSHYTAWWSRSILQIVVDGDTFDKDEVVVREKADPFSVKESLVTVTLIRVTNEERLKLQKAAGK